ncbi:MAG: cation:proton antiporter [Gammaproteobacteria bacterium]|nr:cation:proton antiporter [Gammaproteobacteria bacterium]
MHADPVVFTIFLIFTGAAALATLALYARQSMLVAYIVLGMLLGPSGAGLVEDAEMTRQVAQIGIMFLLFLLGLDLYPQKLIGLFRETVVVTGVSSAVFAGVGFALGWVLGFATMECLIIGVALMFSSTIIGLKLLPTTVLHHRHTGEIIISVLLLQDLIAIIVLLLLQASDQRGMPLVDILLVLLSLPALVLVAWLVERFVVMTLVRRFDKIHEYIFLLAIGWCLGLAQLAESVGLSYEIGAFIAGVLLATSPIALYIADSLKPLRDFFLVIFFFTLGARFDVAILMEVLLPASLLAGLMLTLKPLTFRFLLRRSGEASGRSREVGVRLGQISEFSLLIAVLAMEQRIIGHQASYLIQVAALLTFMVSSYVIVMRYPTPIAISDKLRRD